MGIFSYAPYGFEGRLVSVEVDIRSGLPTTDIVGLPGDAVREAKQRVRVAVTNSGFEFPLRRVLVNLAPAGVKKAGASFDLPIAVAVLSASGQIAPMNVAVLVVGELELGGRVRSVSGVLAAVGVGLSHGLRHFIVPEANREEACAMRDGEVWSCATLDDAVASYRAIADGRLPPPRRGLTARGRQAARATHEGGDYSDLRGQVLLKRAMEVAASGGHNVLLFGPQGVGKSMAAHRLPSILPPLERSDALVVTRLHSLAGVLPEHAGMIEEPAFRSPHHSASLEGMLGGGRTILPGEVSLAHKGILFLDEATEYRRNVLQALREPCEARSVTIVRAGAIHTFPAAFQLVAAANPCPCGNLGHPERTCLCSTAEVERYWRRFGGPLLDRIDMRILVQPTDPEGILSDGYESSSQMRMRVAEARCRQEYRLADSRACCNAELSTGDVRALCGLDGDAEQSFYGASKKLMLSTRAALSILKVSRTIADLEGSDTVRSEHVLEATAYRRWGDMDSIFELFHAPLAANSG